MRFVDSCRVRVIAGDGGNGVVAFRREKYVPFGGPSGGDGGRGGDVIFVVDPGLSTLLDILYSATLRAQRGEHGQGSDCYGKKGADLEVRVPPGTQVFDEATGEPLFDLTEHHQRVVVAKGGGGGRGNIHFATPYDRAPRKAEPGQPGEDKQLRLELKVLADVGLLGFPNVGKSTLIAAVSRARPKIADYPFTTLTPNLGVVRVGEGSSFVLADIPGLIPGASEGAGLGIQFLKHVERTRALLHLVTLDPGEGREPLADYLALRRELEAFSPDLAARPELVALTKADLPDVREAYGDLRAKFRREGVELLLLSAATGEGVAECMRALWHALSEAPQPGVTHPTGKPKRKARHPKGEGPEAGGADVVEGGAYIDGADDEAIDAIDAGAEAIDDVDIDSTDIDAAVADKTDIDTIYAGIDSIDVADVREVDAAPEGDEEGVDAPAGEGREGGRAGAKGGPKKGAARAAEPASKAKPKAAGASAKAQSGASAKAKPKAAKGATKSSARAAKASKPRATKRAGSKTVKRAATKAAKPKATRRATAKAVKRVASGAAKPKTAKRATAAKAATKRATAKAATKRAAAKVSKRAAASTAAKPKAAKRAVVSKAVKRGAVSKAARRATTSRVAKAPSRSGPGARAAKAARAKATKPAKAKGGARRA